jgi:hypothetical protein
MGGGLGHEAVEMVDEGGGAGADGAGGDGAGADAIGAKFGGDVAQAAFEGGFDRAHEVIVGDDVVGAGEGDGQAGHADEGVGGDIDGGVDAGYCSAVAAGFPPGGVRRGPLVSGHFQPVGTPPPNPPPPCAAQRSRPRRLAG